MRTKQEEILLLDGAMGTMLQSAGLPAGLAPEVWNIENPAAVRAVHAAYAAAGSQIVCTNTFGANARKCAGSGYAPAEVIAAGVAVAKSAVGPGVHVALDVGPIGQLLEPYGTMTFNEAYDLYREMVTAGERAGAELVLFETMSDLYELKAAVLAAKENTSLPVWASMTMEKTGRTYLGVTVSAMGLTLQGLGVDAMGFNCSLGPRELLPMVEELARWTDRPLFLKPNAGLPDPQSGAYTMTAASFAADLSQAASLGVMALGGCCGTTPDFIRALRAALHGKHRAPRQKAEGRGVCSARRTAPFTGVRVIGERINPTGKKRFQAALRDGDMDYIKEQAVEQQDAGADILDVNVGLPGVDEPEMMVKVVKAIQSVTDLPLQIDSSSPAAIEAGLRAVSGKAIVNSVNGDEKTLRAILPLCRKYGAAVVGLTMDESGIPRTAEGRIALAERILQAALSYGIAREDVLIDCLTLTVSAQQEQAAETLKAVHHVRSAMGLQTVLGVSNISFGLPARENITVSFLTQALAAGLTLPIVNPNQTAVMDAVAAYKVLSCQDRDSAAYIARFADAGTSASAPAASREMTIMEAIRKGLSAETAALTEKALESMAALDVVNTLLIPALDAVGDDYERQRIFLPQLMNAANAACAGFDAVKARIAQDGAGSLSKGKIILATVKGDIHDIGKNIVKVVLENYGYTVIDLGRDVPPETVVDAAVREDVKLVGLSALMTTTLDSMAATIAALRSSGHACKIMVGGAVLTEEYAMRIGADYYTKDAKQSADVAKLVLG